MGYESNYFSPRLERVGVSPDPDQAPKEKTLLGLLQNEETQQLATLFLEKRNPDLAEKLLKKETLEGADLKRMAKASQEILSAHEQLERLSSIFGSAKFWDEATKADPRLQECRANLEDDQLENLFNKEYILEIYLEDLSSSSSSSTFKKLNALAEANQKMENIYSQKEEDLDKLIKQFGNSTGFLPSELRTITREKDRIKREKSIDKYIKNRFPISRTKRLLSKPFPVSPFKSVQERDNYRQEISSLADQVDDLVKEIETDLIPDQEKAFQGMAGVLAKDVDWQDHIVNKSLELINQKQADIAKEGKGRPQENKQGKAAMTFAKASYQLSPEGVAEKQRMWNEHKKEVAIATIQEQLKKTGVPILPGQFEDLTEAEVDIFWTKAGDPGAMSVPLSGQAFDLTGIPSLDDQKASFLNSADQSFWAKMVRTLWDNILK